MLFFQLFTIFFAVCMLYVIRIHKKKGHFDSFEFTLWIGVWLAFIVLSIFPQLLTSISLFFHIGRVFDMVVILAFMVLSFVVVSDRIALRTLEKKLEEKVREKAISEASKK